MHLNTKEMKKIIKTTLIIMAFVTIVASVGFLNYKVWRAEHPQAATWTFFIRNK